MTRITDKGDVCGVWSPQKKRHCQVPAGLGVDGSLGHGPCHYHVAADVHSGDDTLETTKRHASTMQQGKVKQMFRYEMEGDSRLATILRGMGAEMVVDTGRNGVASLDLDYEMKAMRAMLILFMERYEAREEALLQWATAYRNNEVCEPPARMLDITQGHKAVVGIAQVAKTMHEIQGSVPKAEFIQMMVDMADVVNAEVSDKATRRRIKRQWLEVTAKHVTA